MSIVSTWQARATLSTRSLESLRASTTLDRRLDQSVELEALEQIARYLDRAGLGEGWLVMFDLRKEPSWADRLFVREAVHADKTIHVVGC